MLQSPRADRRFKRLLATAETPAAQLYALAGLCFTDPGEFRRVVPPYLANNPEQDNPVSAAPRLDSRGEGSLACSVTGYIRDWEGWCPRG